MLHQRSQLQWHLKVSSKFRHETKILKTQIGGESGIQTAVQDDGRPVFKFTTAAGTGGNGFIAPGEIQSAALGQHQRLTHRHQIDQT